MKTYNLEIGTQVKLKDYFPYSDYRNHLGETATIIEVKGTAIDAGFTHSIMWKDGSTSNTYIDNMIPIEKEWDNESNY